MKIRNGFVTNSSSSSYTVSYNVKYEFLIPCLSTIQSRFGIEGLKKLYEETYKHEDYIEFRDTYSEIESMFEFVPDKFYEREENED